jgi:CubicO group peptidase (beta-lactamase class C family)
VAKKGNCLMGGSEKVSKGFKDVTLANWRASPFSKWAFHHVREVVPSAEIRNDPQVIWKLQERAPPFETAALTSLINETSTDSVVILHDNKIMFETYRNGMGPDDQHILFSVSKSILGLIAGCLIRDDIIKESDFITDYLPEMLGTAYDRASIRDALDMRVGVYFDEDYTAQDGPIIDYRYAANWNPTPESKNAITLKSFFASLKQGDGPHGGDFHYVSPNTDLLAWLFERACGRRYTDLVSDYLWKPMGSERSAYITVDRIGGMRAAGGICMIPRDLARLGMLLAQNGMRDCQQIIPNAWIADFYEGGDRDAWNNGSFKDFFASKAMHYRSKWYVCQKAGRLLHGFGIHGQYLFVDQDRKLSIAWLSSEADPLDSQVSHRILSIVNEIRGAWDTV